jgi:hypothetical protein
MRFEDTYVPLARREQVYNRRCRSSVHRHASGDEDRADSSELGEATLRRWLDGDLGIYGPRRPELAPVLIDDAVPKGGVVVRDIGGVTVTEIVRLVKPNLDVRPDRGAYA